MPNGIYAAEAHLNTTSGDIRLESSELHVAGVFDIRWETAQRLRSLGKIVMG